MSGETKQPITWQNAFDNNISELTNDDENDNRASVMGEIKQKFQELLGRIQEENGNVEAINGHIERLTQLIAKLRECWTELQRIIEQLKQENGQGAEELRKLRNLVDKKPNLNLIRETLIEMIGRIGSNNENAANLGNQLSELSGLIDEICREAESTRTNLEERAQQAQQAQEREERQRQEAKLAEDRQRAQIAEGRQRAQIVAEEKKQAPLTEDREAKEHIKNNTQTFKTELLKGLQKINRDQFKQGSIRREIMLAFNNTIINPHRNDPNFRDLIPILESQKKKQVDNLVRALLLNIKAVQYNNDGTFKRAIRDVINTLQFNTNTGTFDFNRRGGWRDNTQLKSLSMTKPIRSLRSLKKKKKKRTKKHKRKNKGRKTRNKKRRRKKTKKFSRR